MYPLDALREAAGRLPRGRFVALRTAHVSAVHAPQEATRLVDDFAAGLR